MRGGNLGFYIMGAAILLSSCAVKYTLPDYDKVQDANLELITLSNKVGETIDSLERKQYNLFPKAENFVSAQIFLIIDSTKIFTVDYHQTFGYVVEMTATDDHKYRGINLDPEGTVLLQDYLDTLPAFDHWYSLRKWPLEHKYGIMDYDDDLGLPIRDYEINECSYGFNYNQTFYGLACCGISCITGSLAIINIFNNDALTKDNEAAYAAMGIVTGIGISTFAGFSYGKRFDRAEIVRAIKAGRQLKLVE